MNKAKVLLSSLVGCVSLTVMSLAVTFAWYANSDRLSINTINMSIHGDKKLNISTSTDPDSFVEHLEQTDFEQQLSDLTFAPVSSMNKQSWMKEKNSKPLFYDCSNHGANNYGVPSPIIMNKGYFSQKIYLLTDTSYTVGLDISSCVFESSEGDNLLRAEQLVKEDPSLNKEEIKQQLDNLLNCLRVSILIPDEDRYQYVIIDPCKQEGDVTYLGGRLDNDTDGYYDYYTQEGQYKEIVYGEVNDRSLIVYDRPSNLYVEPLIVGNSFTASTRGDIHRFNEEKSKNNGFTIATEQSLSLDELDNDDPLFQIECLENEPREIIVSIYLEGWDKDCVNATMGASFNSKLSFKLLRRIY